MEPLSLFEISKRVEAPKFNTRVVEGIPYHQFKGAIPYLENRFMEIEPIANRIGLRFQGIRMCTPFVENRESYIMHRSSSGTRLRLDASDLYMISVHYEYQGVACKPCYLRLPYVRRGNEILMDGKTFFLSPVLIDRGTNVTKDSIFLSAIRRSKINFTRMTYSINVNGFRTNAATIQATLHMGSKEAAGKLLASGTDRIRINPITFMYLLIQKGVRGAFKEYFGLDAIFEEGSFEALCKKYPLSQYTIMSSSGIKPRRVDKEKYNPTIHMIIKDVSYENQEFLNTMGVNFFYLYDYFTHIIDLDNMDSTDLWEVIAGHVIFNYNESNAELASRVRRHIERSVDVLLSQSAYKELEMDGIIVNDIYELMAWLIKNAQSIFINKNPASMENKRLDSLHYTLSPITYSINRLVYGLLNYDTPPEFSKIEARLRAHINEGLIREIRKDHGEVSSIQCSTDNIFISSTRNIVPQSRALSKTSEKGMPMYNPDNFLHSSILPYCQISGISKPMPTGRGYINPYVSLDEHCNTSHDPVYNNCLNRLTNMIRYDYGFNEEI